MPRKTFNVHTSLLFDPKKKEFVKDVSIEIDPVAGSIAGVTERSPSSPVVLAAGDLDLRGKIVLPGLVDSHTHIFLHAYSERSSLEQMRDEAAVERIVRATRHATAALMAGYTTYRDLGTEGLGAADIGLRDAINRGLTPGPRLFVATDPLASSGGYEVRVESRANGLVPPHLADVGDGADGVRAAVRRRVGAGADVIKFYADYRRKALRFPNPGSLPFPPTTGEASPAVPLFGQDEMDAMVREARLARLPIAAHAIEGDVAIAAARAGVTSVEHVFMVTDETIEELHTQGTIWVPTLATAEVEAPRAMYEHLKVMVKRAHDIGVRLAAGGDTGVFNHGLSARELEIMIEAGIPVEDVLECCTVGGWEACGKDQCGFRFGWFEKGCRADVIALDADPRKDRKALRKVSFVMKDGKVWKKDGQPVGIFVPPQWPDDTDEDGDRHTSDFDTEWVDLKIDEEHGDLPVPSPVCRTQR